MQFISSFWPNHLPKRMEEYREKYEHHWIIEMSDKGVDEARKYFNEFFNTYEGSFFECNKEEGGKALLHRFVAGGAVGRMHAIHEKKYDKHYGKKLHNFQDYEQLSIGGEKIGGASGAAYLLVEKKRKAEEDTKKAEEGKNDKFLNLFLSG